MTSTRFRFGPDLRLSAGVFLLGLGALALALGTDDRGGELLWGTAAVVLIGYALGDVLFWPRLVVDASGLRIRSPFARTELAWAEIDDIRADVRSRYGIRTTALEVDAGPTLVVFTRRALGADPSTVYELIRGVDPRR